MFTRILVIASLLSYLALQSSPASASGMDIDGYCVSRGYAFAFARDTNDAFSWVCSEIDDPEPDGINLNRLCRWQYGYGYRAVYADRHDAYSWSCVK